MACRDVEEREGFAFLRKSRFADLTVQRTVIQRRSLRIPFISLQKKKDTHFCGYLFPFGGERGIRTLERVLAVTRFPIVRLRPTQPSLQQYLTTFRYYSIILNPLQGYFIKIFVVWNIIAPTPHKTYSFCNALLTTKMRYGRIIFTNI